MSITASPPALDRGIRPHIGLVLAASLVGLVLGLAPVALTLALLALVGSWAVLANPDRATLVVLGVIYTNAAVVAVNFHGVPGLAGRLPFLLLALPIVYYVFVRHEVVIWNLAASWLAIFGIAYFLSALLSPTREDTFSFLVVFVTEGLGLFLLLINCMRTPLVWRACLAVIVASGALMSSVSVVQFISGDLWRDFGGFGQISDVFVANASDPATWSGTEWPVGDARLAGPIGEANFFAMVLVTLLPYCFYLAKSAGSRAVRVAWIAAGGLILAGVALTYSRGAIVALVVVIGFLAVVGLLPRRTLVFMLVAGIALVTLVPSYGARMESLVSAVHVGAGTDSGERADAAARGRYSEVVSAFKVYGDHPVLGVGPGQFPVYYQRYVGDLGGGVHTGDGGRQAHNLIAGLAAETGTLGLLSFFGAIGAILLGLVRVRRLPHARAAGTAALTSILLLLCSSLFLHMAYMRYLWVHLAIAAALPIVIRREEGPISDAGAPVTTVASAGSRSTR
jgi:O-antigen ligase